MNRPCKPCIKSDCAPKWCYEFCQNCQIDTVTLDLTFILLLTGIILIILSKQINK